MNDIKLNFIKGKEVVISSRVQKCCLHWIACESACMKPVRLRMRTSNVCQSGSVIFYKSRIGQLNASQLFVCARGVWSYISR